jgi:hypothetical protein
MGLDDYQISSLLLPNFGIALPMYERMRSVYIRTHRLSGVCKAHK